MTFLTNQAGEKRGIFSECYEEITLVNKPPILGEGEVFCYSLILLSIAQKSATSQAQDLKVPEPGFGIPASVPGRT